MPGPPPKPNELKALEGNPGKRRLKNSPKPERVLGLKCPKFVGRYGAQEWKRITPELARLGMLTKIDQAALEMYCRTYQKWREAEDFINDKGTIFTIKDDDVVNEKGEIVKKGKIKYIQQLPQVSIAQQCAEYCRKMIAEFGLSPAARSRLDIKPKEVSEQDMQDFEDTLD